VFVDESDELVYLFVDESDELVFEDDENDSDYEAPDQKYCICKQPYGKR
jgi:hypothetical protein